MIPVEEEALPRRVRVVRDVWIPMPDGVHLAARVWLPTDADTAPVPGILEMLPYRKSDGTALRDAKNAAWFAGHGYAVVRVDLRGTGNSEGIITDEYTPQELDDGVACLDWIASQPWCTGKVGMMGISWGGFNALQVAALAPTNLHAVLSLSSTDDRYADDVHYKGGAVLADEALPWATTMLARNAMPPEPRVWGEGWVDGWLERLEHTPPFVQAWVEHQRRDEFWQHGSICENPERIECPVFLVSGWTDAYRDAVLRMLQSLSVPRRGLIGPWSHAWPHQAVPGPQIGFLQEALAWWDRWLKDEDNGADEKPSLTAWVQDSIPPASYYEHRPGRWVTEDSWPSSGISPTPLTLTADGAELGDPAAPAAAEIDVFPKEAHGLLAGRSCSYGAFFDLPGDQRTEDANSTTFTTEPLTEPLDVLGIPVAELRIRADQPQAQVTIRVCDVAPDRSSALITRGVLNLTHRDSHAEPQALTPGQWYTVRFPLDSIGYSVPAGHRLRVSVAPSYWPMVWPSPKPTRLAVSVPDSRIHLPTRPAQQEAEVTFAEPEHLQPFEHDLLPGPDRGEVTRDLATGRVTVTYESGGGYTRQELDEPVQYRTASKDSFSILEGDPLSAVVETTRKLELRRGAQQVEVLAAGEMSSDEDSFHISTSLTARRDGAAVFEREWTFTTPRDFT